jgi:arylformamidase
MHNGARRYWPRTADVCLERRVPCFDISPTVCEDLAVFPGDTLYRRNVAMGFEAGDHLALSSITTTVHLGAHADAPSHYVAHGASIDTRDPNLYVGACQVLHVTLPRGERILPAHLEHKTIAAPRVLFRTGSFTDPNAWCDDFNALSPELVHVLANRGVRLVGIDTPSIDPAPAKVLVSHHAVAARDLAVLEGLVLEQVPEGLYTLVALPLKLRGADASPVRAVLWEAGKWID